MPTHLGGLGVRNANLVSTALQLRWPWLQRSEPSKPWASFRIRFNPLVLVLFRQACTSVVGDGRSTLFWTDRWIDGRSIELLAPVVFAIVHCRITRRRTVADGLLGSAWIQDISGPLNAQGVAEFLSLADSLAARALTPGQEDVLRWIWSPSSTYSAQSAYLHFFEDRPVSPTWTQIWRCWAPLKCRIWLWLACANRCWTADRLERRNLPFCARCPLCDQAPETMSHLLMDCPFSKSVLHEVFSKANALCCLLSPSESLGLGLRLAPGGSGVK